MPAAKFRAILPHPDERQRRLLIGAEARSLGHGGIRAVPVPPVSVRPLRRSGCGSGSNTPIVAGGAAALLAGGAAIVVATRRGKATRA